MRLYSVHLRRHGRDPERDLALVKEGFSWPAFVFGFAWALFSRMWWAAIGLFAIAVLAAWAAARWLPGEASEGLVALAVALAVGFVGNDLRRWTLQRGGFDEVAMVTGRNREEALRRFLDDADVSRNGIFP